ncbi:camp-dependent protein kinase catalytic subunit [Tulasnella sp. JGI-2019a]|nr:camp-dependent protein kinase catalytic subunit [Tulasnella sp. JGI-2019a]KAG9038337.1 camp-dependent protein kinase catalytic subunit [Tulasnella sp. JGI-2019a]
MSTPATTMDIGASPSQHEFTDDLRNLLEIPMSGVKLGLANSTPDMVDSSVHSYDTSSLSTRSSMASSFASRGTCHTSSAEQERAPSPVLKVTSDDLRFSYSDRMGSISQDFIEESVDGTAIDVSVDSTPVPETIPMPSVVEITETSQLPSKHALSDAGIKIISGVQQQSVLVRAPVIPSSTSTPKKRPRYGLGDFMFHRTLGTGSFGRVHLVQSIHNGRHYAVKVLLKEKVVRLKQVEHTNSEREMLHRARHPFLVNLWGTFQDNQNLYMVMDFVAGGELFSLLRKSGRFPNPVAKFYAAEVSMAIDYLHSINIIYRDLKPENILIGADGHIKVTDFGFAKFVPDLTYTLCGTPDYLAPEVIQQKGYNKSVDWYSVGILIFEMLAGYPPFYIEPGPNGVSHVALYEKILSGVVAYPNFFEPLAIDIISNCLTTDLSKRYGNMKFGSKDIFGHQWFAEVGWERIYKKEIPPPFVPDLGSEGDTSLFDRYPEADISSYGQPAHDPYQHLFADWS